MRRDLQLDLRLDLGSVVGPGPTTAGRARTVTVYRVMAVASAATPHVTAEIVVMSATLVMGAFLPVTLPRPPVPAMCGMCGMPVWRAMGAISAGAQAGAPIIAPVTDAIFGITAIVAVVDETGVAVVTDAPIPRAVTPALREAATIGTPVIHARHLVKLAPVKQVRKTQVGTTAAAISATATTPITGTTGVSPMLPDGALSLAAVATTTGAAVNIASKVQITGG